MKRFNTEAIVLKNVNYKDADKIYTLLSKDYGKISARGRGVRKITSKRAGNLDTLNLISVKITESNGFRYIDEVKTLSSHRNIKSDYELLRKAYYIAELTNKSLEEDSEQLDLFKLLKGTLKILNTRKYSPELITCFYEVQLLRLLGYMPDIKKLSFDKNISNTIKNLLTVKLDNITKDDLIKIEPIIKSYIYEYLGEKFKSLEI